MDVTCAEAKEFRNTESSDIRKLQWVRRKRMSWQPAGVVRGAEMFVMFALLLEPRSQRLLICSFLKLHCMRKNTARRNMVDGVLARQYPLPSTMQGLDNLDPLNHTCSLPRHDEDMIVCGYLGDVGDR